MPEQNSGSDDRGGGGGGGSVRNLPDYNNALGDFLKFPPGDLRQTYSDVLMQVYPLQANLKKLESFCDEYFGLPKDSFIEIKPVAPWVFMEVCDYGKMALKGQNIGWVSQHELAFGFPVAIYDRDSNGKRFKDWALVFPFIYVDNPVSMSLGRQVYGWPKAGIEIRSARANLAPDLRCLATIDLRSGPERSAAGDASETRFLEVFQRQPLLSGRAGVASLFAYLARMNADYMTLMSAGFDLVRNAGYDWKEPPRTADGIVEKFGPMIAQYGTWYDYVEGFLRSASKMARGRQAALQMPFGNRTDSDTTDAQMGEVKTITLKQFRDAEDPESSCYRAIVVSSMGYSQPIDGGFLVSDVLSPDISGGISINFCDSRATGSSGTQDIVQSLGLGETSTIGSKTIHTLQPVMPFWAKLNLTCGSGDFQWWRSKGEGWSFDRKPGGPETAPHISGPKDSTSIPYTKVGSGAAQELRGPLESGNFGLRVFALEAREDKLQELCNNYLHASMQSSFRFEVKRPSEEMVPYLKHSDTGFLLMLVSSFDGLSGKGFGAEGKNLHDRVLTFAIPATCSYQGSDSSLQGKRKEVLIPVYTFVEQDWDFLTEYEVYGRLALKSDLQSPPENWIDDSKDKSELLTVYTTIFPREGIAQSARVMPLVQIWKSKSHASDSSLPWENLEFMTAESTPLRQTPPGGSGSAAVVLATTARTLNRQQHVFETLIGQRYAFESLLRGYLKLIGLPDPHDPAAAGANIVSIGLKQIRDAVLPTSASYQEIVSVRRDISGGWEFHAEEPKLQLYIHKYGSFDIAETMGLVHDAPESMDLGGEKYQRYSLATIPGARAVGKMTEQPAISLCRSISSGQWTDGTNIARALSD